MPAAYPYERRFHIFTAVAILLLIGIFFLSVRSAEFSTMTTRLLLWTAVAIVVAGVLGGCFFAASGGLWKLKGSYTVELNDGKLIQRRAGAAPVELPLDQIESLCEGRGQLIAKGGNPEKQIAIPREIQGFHELKRQLAASRAITPLKTKFPLLGLLSLVLTMVVWYLLFTSHKRRVVLLSGAAALLLQVWAIFALRRIWRAKLGTKLVFLWSQVSYLLVIAWMVFHRVRAIF